MKYNLLFNKDFETSNLRFYYTNHKNKQQSSSIFTKNFVFSEYITLIKI